MLSMLKKTKEDIYTYFKGPKWGLILSKYNRLFPEGIPTV